MNKKLIALVAPLAFAALQAQAADTVASGSNTASSSATIIRPVTVANGGALAFGTIIRPSTGTTTYSVAAADAARSVSGSDGLYLSTTGSTNASFTITGEGGYAITVAIPATFSLSDGTNSLVVTTANNMSGAAGSQALSGSLGAAGNLTVKVGGSVPVTSTTATGTYSGSFALTATYN